MIAGKLKMRREHPKTRAQAFLVVEGWTDRTVFDTYIDGESCYIAVGYGKSNVLEIMARLTQMKVEGALAVVDADFDPILSRLLSSQSLIYTDTHDLETMILRSPALTRLLNHYRIAPEKRRLLPDLLIKAAQPLGCLRLLNERANLGLSFKSLAPEDYFAFFNGRTLEVDLPLLAERVCQRSSCPVSAHDLEARLRALLCSNREDPWILCSGHDMVEFLALILSQWCEHAIYRKIDDSLSRAENIPVSESLEDRLYLAWESVFFFGTKIHAAIEKWEAEHKPMKVFKRWG